jgi:ferritin-like metal-binding protein YciE
MQTAHELFLHELGDMLDAEQKLVEALGEQAEESSDPKVKQAFEQHRQQTVQQAQRLRQAFEILGEEPEKTECKGIKGLKEEHDSFAEEDPSPDILDIFNVGAAIKTERYEISAYESLVRLGEEMGHDRVVRLLNQNLREEEQTLKKMDGFSRKLKPEQLGESESEEANVEMQQAGRSRSSSRNGSRSSSRNGSRSSSSRSRSSSSSRSSGRKSARSSSGSRRRRAA